VGTGVGAGVGDLLGETVGALVGTAVSAAVGTMVDAAVVMVPTISKKIWMLPVLLIKKNSGMMIDI